MAPRIPDYTKLFPAADSEDLQAYLPNKKDQKKYSEEVAALDAQLKAAIQGARRQCQEAGGTDAAFEAALEVLRTRENAIWQDFKDNILSVGDLHAMDADNLDRMLELAQQRAQSATLYVE